jgi:hypothetical protein
MKAKSGGRSKVEPSRALTKVASAKGTRTSERQLLTATKALGGLGLALKVPLDAYAIDEIRAGINEIAVGRDEVPLTRENLLAAARVISEALKPVTDTVIGRLDSGEFVVVNHPVIEMIDEAIDALADLDRGKTHRVLEAASHQANRALTTEQRKRDETLLTTVAIVQRKYGFKTFAQAARFVAKRKRELGQTRDGEPYTAQTFIRLRDYYRKLNKSMSYARN